MRISTLIVSLCGCLCAAGSSQPTQDGVSFPGPDELLRYACEVASRKDIEEQATDRICALIKAEFPGARFDPDCKSVIEKGWDFVKARCPKGRLSMPSPQDIEKYVCQVATEKMIEDMATDAICELLNETFPSVHFNPDCHTAVERAWDAVKSFCPKGRLSMPSPQDIERLICQFATEKMIEDKAVDKICELVNKTWPSIHFSPDCHTVVQEAWDTAAAACPKGAVSMPSPQDVEKYVCDVVTQRMVEEAATHEVCDLIAKEFPGAHFSPDCRTVLERAWDTAKSFCPGGGAPAPTPREVEKYVCRVAKTPAVERRVLGAMCKEVRAELPVPDAVCEAILRRAWTKAAAMCPSQAADAIVV
mmetsp:Transcript_106400/g.328634  ORF Transcript_106400/g.328634 Transcript_106400/m.328634 type:complete len:361 (+) Transcript_106400:74-1156(+)